MAAGTTQDGILGARGPPLLILAPVAYKRYSLDLTLRSSRSDAAERVSRRLGFQPMERQSHHRVEQDLITRGQMVAIKRNMPLDQDKRERSFRKLGKSLRNVPKQPSPEEVHDLRTRTRRLESTLHALMLDQKQDGRRLLRTVAPIRKKAGKVRDMDVLTGFAATLANDDRKCLTQLLEYLGAKPLQSARRLRAAVAQKRKKARRRLRRYSGLMRRNASRKSEPNNPGWPVDATAIALQLSSQLAAWPRLNSTNLHPYRLKVKELRYVLQLAEGQDSELVEALGEVKDAIGEWHDWSELAALAKQILNHGSGCKVLQQIRDTTTAKFDHALSVAETMRKKFLGVSSGRNARRRSGPVKLKEPVLITAARLAA